MITQIGITAGEIWRFLDEHKEVKLSDLAKGIEKPRDLTLMSLGWLAREGHVVMEDGPDYKIYLRKE